jgi:hypothetical protein
MVMTSQSLNMEGPIPVMTIYLTDNWLTGAWQGTDVPARWKWADAAVQSSKLGKWGREVCPNLPKQASTGRHVPAN